MDFKRNLKLRLYFAIAYVFIGGAIIAAVAAGAVKSEFASSVGAVLLTLGIAKIVQYKRITRSEESYTARKIAETDERNIQIWTAARSMAVSGYIICVGIAAIVLYIFDMSYEAQILSYSLMLFIAVYWVCYVIVKKKY